MIEVTLKETAVFQHYVETKNGAIFLCNLTFSEDNANLALPYGNRIVLKLSELSIVADKSNYSPSLSRLLIGGRYVSASYRYDAPNKTLTIFPYTESLSVGGRMFSTIDLAISK